jgi:DMSO/TMAO reductase YedYZ heme-binding membrane subunit
VLDSFAPVGWLSIVVPFVSAYRPIWLGLGTVAFDLLLALVITSLLRTRVGQRTWRAIHWAAYLCWPVALWHGLGTGSDSREPLVLAVDAICVAAVLVATWWRLSLSERPGLGRPALVAASLVALGATIAFAVLGPLGSNWARRSGTPSKHEATTAASAAVHTDQRHVRWSARDEVIR